MISEFEHWYQNDGRFNVGEGPDNYFDTIINGGCVVEALDIKIYMGMAFEAGQKSVTGDTQ